MNETYESRIVEIARRLPEGPCLIALVPSIDRDQAAAIAGDLAQLLARGRAGHTMLLSLEDPPPALDHEIGVEGGPGLTEILAGRATLADVAAHGRARGYIFVPAGKRAAAGRTLAASTAFRSLCRSAVARGGTVLAFLAADSLPGDPPPFARGVIWLGPAPEGAGPDGWPTLGSVAPPGPPDPPPASDGGADAVETPAGTPASGTGAPEREPGGRRGAVSGAPGPGRARSRRRVERRRRGQWARLLVFLLAVAVVLGLALTAYALLWPRPVVPLLPENDSLWLAPP